MEFLTTLRQVLLSARDLPMDEDLYLPIEAAWSLDSACAILETKEDGTPPRFAIEHHLDLACGADEVWTVVSRVRERLLDAPAELLLRALLYYYDNNDFLRI